MSRAAADVQLGFDFAPPLAPGAPLDPLALRLAAAGLVPTHAAGDVDRSLSAPDAMVRGAPWSLPSRLFRHPIAFIGGDHRPDGRCTILVRHPLLVDHPFVRHVAERLHRAPGWEETDALGRDLGAPPRRWHAVDLMTLRHCRDLLATRRFTDDAAIVAAVAHALLAAGPAAPTVRQAREVLEAVGTPEPADWSDAALRGGVLSATRAPRAGKAAEDAWAVSVADRGAAGAWALVHGHEDGWFVPRPAGGLALSAKGLRRRGIALGGAA